MVMVVHWDRLSSQLGGVIMMNQEGMVGQIKCLNGPGSGPLRIGIATGLVVVKGGRIMVMDMDMDGRDDLFVYGLTDICWWQSPFHKVPF